MIITLKLITIKVEAYKVDGVGIRFLQKYSEVVLSWQNL